MDRKIQKNNSIKLDHTLKEALLEYSNFSNSTEENSFHDSLKMRHMYTFFDRTKIIVVIMNDPTGWVSL